MRMSKADVKRLGLPSLGVRQHQPQGERGRLAISQRRSLSRVGTPSAVVYESADSGKAVPIPRFIKRRRPTGRRRIDRPGVTNPRLVGVQSASED